VDGHYLASVITITLFPTSAPNLKEMGWIEKHFMFFPFSHVEENKKTNSMYQLH
jgi:competence transcription factor ComK